MLTTPQSDISPPELSKMDAPEVGVASPVKVLSLRSRKVHVSPSPQKRTPRVCLLLDVTKLKRLEQKK